MNANRMRCERMIIDVMTAIDNPKKHKGSAPNVEFWINQFARMSDKEFEEFVCTPLSIYAQTNGMVREPGMLDIMRALDIIKVPLLEEVYMPYKFINTEGKPIKSKKAVVVYLHIKRMKQTLALKIHSSFSTKIRDARTGLLTSEDKIARESDREFESLAISNLSATMKELSKPRGDSINDKNIMNSAVKSFGRVRLDELDDDPSDALAKNLLNVYLLGAGLTSNLILTDYTTPYTLKNKQKKIQFA